VLIESAGHQPLVATQQQSMARTNSPECIFSPGAALYKAHTDQCQRIKSPVRRQFIRRHALQLRLEPVVICLRLIQPSRSISFSSNIARTFESTV